MAGPAFGLIPVKSSTSQYYTASVGRYFVPSSDATALFIGDPVSLTTTADTAGKYITVTRTNVATNNKMVGVVVGILPLTDEFKTVEPLKVPYRAASTNAYVLVADDPMQEYIGAEDAAGAALVATDVGNLGLFTSGAGSTVYGRSGFQLKSASFASTSAVTDQLMLLGLLNRPDLVLGTGTTTGAVFRVKINELMHQYATPSATI